MKTIDPLHLEALYETGKPIELIDVRPQDEFDRLHALGARSVPLPDFIPSRSPENPSAALSGAALFHLPKRNAGKVRRRTAAPRWF